MTFDELPKIPDDDADFTPELARKIIAQYQELLRRALAKPIATDNEWLDRHVETFISLAKPGSGKINDGW